MRVWCVPLRDLDDQRLLGERRELSSMISLIIRAESRGGFKTKGISLFYRNRFSFVEKRYMAQIKELRYRGFQPAKMMNFGQMYSKFPALAKTTERSGWKSGGEWFQSIGRAKTDLASRWDSGISRAGGVNKPRWTRRGSPKWYTPKGYSQELDSRFKYRKKAYTEWDMNFRKVVERVAQFEKVASDQYEEIAKGLEVFKVDLNFDGNKLKKEFRKLSKKYHPDLNQGDPVAEEKFKEIASAYNALTGPGHKRIRDELREKGKTTPRKIRMSWGKKETSAIHPSIAKLKVTYQSLFNIGFIARPLIKRIKDFLTNLSDAVNPTPEEIKRAVELDKKAWKLLHDMGYQTRSEQNWEIGKNLGLTLLFIIIGNWHIIYPVLAHVSRAAAKTLKIIMKFISRKFGEGKKYIKQKVKLLKKMLEKRPAKEQMAVREATLTAARKLRINLKRSPASL